MIMTVRDTDVLKEQILSAYAEYPEDSEIIKWLCFARNTAEAVADHFYGSHNKAEFYHGVLNDPRIVGHTAVKILESYYGYLK